MNFFDHKGLGNHLLQLCPKVVKHSVYLNVNGARRDNATPGRTTAWERDAVHIIQKAGGLQSRDAREKKTPISVQLARRVWLYLISYSGQSYL